MLELTIPKTDLWDELNQAIYPCKGTEIAFGAFARFTFKMGSKWCKVFLSKEQKTMKKPLTIYAV